MKKVILQTLIISMIALLYSCNYTPQNTTNSNGENESIPTSTLEQYLLDRLSQYPNWKNNGAQQNEFNKEFEKELLGKLKNDKTFFSDYRFHFCGLGDIEVNGKYGLHFVYSQADKDWNYRNNLPICGDVIVLIDKADALNLDLTREWKWWRSCGFIGSFVKVGKTPNDYYKYFTHGMPETDKFGLSDFGSHTTEVNLAILIFEADSIYLF